jgi:hypothetical protein
MRNILRCRGENDGSNDGKSVLLAGFGSLGRLDSKLHPDPNRGILTFPLQSRCHARAVDGSGRDLKHNALVLASACVGCAKDISVAIHGYAAIRLRALAAANEVVKVGKGPAAFSRS